MNFRKAKKGSKALVTLDMTALIDVVFLLLIFLLVTTTFRRDEHAFVIDLVNSSSEQVTVTTDKTTVFIAQDGGLHLLDTAGAKPSSESLSFQDLQAKLKELRDSRPEESLVIRGAKTAEYQRIVDVLTLVRDLGFGDVSFAYEKDSSE